MTKPRNRVNVAIGLHRAVPAPVLLVHGACDDVVPPTDATLLEQASAGRARRVIVPGADHASLDASLDAFLVAAPAVTSFIQDAVRDGREEAPRRGAPPRAY
jgi:fermentation-respiration switch protein FrsA (DUF1100 family)